MNGRLHDIAAFARTVNARRRLVFGLNVASLSVAAVWLFGRFDGAAGALAAGLGVLALQQPIFAFWNAVVALALVASGQDRAAVSGYAEAAPTGWPKDGPPRVAVAMFLRHEDAPRALRRLIVLRESLAALDAVFGARVEIHVLSDSSDPAAVAAEKAAFAAAKAALAPAFYRRRAANDGFKGGNLRDFAATADRGLAFAFLLDADGAVDGATLKRFVEIMAAEPRLALLQSLIDPTPARSGFGRALSWSARVGVRSWYLGQAWWQADRGPSGGHGLLLRLDAFREVADRLTRAPGKPPFGGAVLGHDHAEAVALADAGWAVRLLPERVGSYEGHPPSLGAWAAREARWSRATLQYAALALGPTGLSGQARLHLGLWALHHRSWSAAPAALMAAAVAGPLHAALAPLALGLGLSLAPRLAAYAEALAREGARAYGGGLAFARDAALDLGFSALLAFATPLAVLYADLGALWEAAFGRSRAPWPAQEREPAAATPIGDRMVQFDALRLPEERAPSAFLQRMAALDAQARREARPRQE